MVSRRTRVVSWIFRRDHPSRPNAMICCFFSSFKTFAMLREATDPPAAVNVLDVSSESMAAFQVFLYGRFWVFTEAYCIQVFEMVLARKPVKMRPGANCYTSNAKESGKLCVYVSLGRAGKPSCLLSCA
jgi:hypothetical protein